jgi:hypothetical protein
MTKTFLLLLSGLKMLSICAQDTIPIHNKKNLLELSTGYSKHIIQDDIISPYTYKGWKAPVWLKYSHLGKHYIHDLSLYYDRLDLESEITNKLSDFPHYSDNVNAYLSYGLIREICPIRGIKTDFYIGGKIKSYINFRNHHYTGSDQAFSAEQSTSLDIKLSLIKHYNPQNDLIIYSFSLPVLSYALLSGMYNANVSEQINQSDRSENMLLQFIKNGDFVGINKLFEFQSELAVYKSINKMISFVACHYLHYYSFEKHPDNRRTKYLNNQFLIGITLKL